MVRMHGWRHARYYLARPHPRPNHPPHLRLFRRRLEIRCVPEEEPEVTDRKIGRVTFAEAATAAEEVTSTPNERGLGLPPPHARHHDAEVL